MKQLLVSPGSMTGHAAGVTVLGDDLVLVGKEILVAERLAVARRVTTEGDEVWRSGLPTSNAAGFADAAPLDGGVLALGSTGLGDSGQAVLALFAEDGSIVWAQGYGEGNGVHVGVALHTPRGSTNVALVATDCGSGVCDRPTVFSVDSSGQTQDVWARPEWASVRSLATTKGCVIAGGSYNSTDVWVAPLGVAPN